VSDAGPLIVPLTVEALVVNNHVREGESFVRAQMLYGQLEEGRSAQPGLDDADRHFTTDESVEGGAPAQYYNGVYLKWRLPRALTRGVQDPVKEELRFPTIPSRWIVVRYNAAGAAPQAWLVESDYVWPATPKFKTVADVSAYFVVKNKDGAPAPAFVGRHIDLTKEAWSEPGSSLGLTATGAGNPAFAAYQPQNNNVLSFIDVLGEAAAETFSYQVFGWYSRAEEDPLAAIGTAGFAKALEEGLGWTLPEKTDAGLSTRRTLLAGSVNGVEWQSAKKPKGGAQTGLPLAIATGNSSVEALTGLVAAQAAAQPGKTVEPELLEAFQLDALDLLDEPDGEARLAERLHDSLFQRYAGGHAWEIVGAPGQEPPEAAELERESAWLLKLNEAQAKLDAQIGELAGLRLHLYELWWKWFCWLGRYSSNKVDGRKGAPPLKQQDLLEELLPTTAGSVAQQVQEKQAEVEASRKLVPGGTTKEELDAAIVAYEKQQGLPESRLLKRAEATSFHTPNNPVVLLAGAGASGIVPPPATLQCRFPQQLVSGFEFNGQKVAASTAGVAVPRPDLSRVSGAPWPAELIEALVDEAFFTDLGNASAISKALGGDQAAIAAAMAKAPIGVAPGSGVTAWKENPWRPLLLIWSAEYFPIPLGAEQPNWAFEAGRYVWNGEGAVETPLKLGSTILLGTGAVFNMAARLEAFLAGNPHLGKPEKSELEKLLAFVTEQGNDWDLLSQALDGFNEGVQLGAPGVFANPSVSEAEVKSPLSALIGASPGYPPGLPEPSRTTPPASAFQPLRGGQFCFTELALVDEWGQALEPITPTTTKDEDVFMPATMMPGVSSSSARFTVTPAGGGAPPSPAMTPAAGTVTGDGAEIAISALVPSSEKAGSGPLTLTVEGSGFDPKAEPVVSWNGLPLATKCVSATKLEATVPADCLALPETAAVAVSVSRTVRTEAEETIAQVPPAIPQPARLIFEMLAAENDDVVVGPLAPAANPICGWLLPNHLDAALMAYLPGGEPLGEISAGVGPAAKSALLWTAAPGAPYQALAEVEAKVPQLGPMLGQLFKQGPAVFAGFLAAIDETLWTTAPAGVAFENGLATLIGRPLALVRAQAGFELLSGPRRDPSWRYTFDSQPNALGACKLAVELGGQAWLDDGLVGYFEETEYEKFFVVAQAGAPEGGYLHTIGEGDNHLSLAADGSAGAHLSLLLDPRAPVHASTPVLPGTSLALPARAVEAALARLEVSFRLDGVLTDSETTAPSGGGAAATTIRLPLPDVQAGSWSWVEQDASGWTEHATATTDAGAGLGDVPPVLRRGLLRLSGFAKQKTQEKERP